MKSLDRKKYFKIKSGDFMKNNEELRLLTIRLELIKNNLNDKKCFDSFEKEEYKKSILSISKKLSSELNEPSILSVTESMLADANKKQRLLYKKVVDRLFVVINSINAVEDKDVLWSEANGYI